ncbi:iron permease [Phellopilus nigrolimitatus]|nr:iron permease [Phellopilus nigrolimitatus]
MCCAVNDVRQRLHSWLLSWLLLFPGTAMLQGKEESEHSAPASPPSSSIENLASHTSSPGTNEKQTLETPHQHRGTAFWAIILVINATYFIALLETSSISTALPTIIDDLHGTEFVWAGSAYNIAATAFMPTTGGMAQAFGRRPVMLASLLLFSLGSAMCGAAPSDIVLVAGRAVQGAGGAGLFSMANIVLSDIVPLNERGAFNGLLQLTWCVAAGIGPAVGGALAQNGAWRWLFYLNLPITGITAVLVLLFMRLKTPEGDFSEKIKRIDMIGTFLVMSSTLPWSSPRVLVPLIFGALGLVGFLFYEALLAEFPLVPIRLFSNRTSLSGYLQNFIVPIPFTALVFYLPIYFQACKGFSPLHTGTTFFALAFSVAPVSIITGLTILAGVAFGIVFSASYFPVLAPLSAASIAPALAFFAFLRQFGQIWAITVAGSVLQNVLSHKLPPDFAGSAGGSGGGSADIAFSVIPALATTREPLLGEIQRAFAEGLQLAWRVLAGFCALGLLASLLMEGLPLHTTTDKNWGLEEREKARGRGASGEAEAEAGAGRTEEHELEEARPVSVE